MRLSERIKRWLHPRLNRWGISPWVRLSTVLYRGSSFLEGVTKGDRYWRPTTHDDMLITKVERPAPTLAPGLILYHGESQGDCVYVSRWNRHYRKTGVYESAFMRHDKLDETWIYNGHLLVEAQRRRNRIIKQFDAFVASVVDRSDR